MMDTVKVTVGMEWGNVGYAATEGSLNIKNLNELLRFYDFCP